MSLSNKNKTTLIILLGAIAAIGPFTIDMYLPAFSAIAAELGVAEQHMSYTLTSYFIGISLGQIINGPIIDKFGRKKPLMIGLVIYTIASLGLVFTLSLEYMIVLRFVQALGASVGMVTSLAIVRDIYKGEEIAKMLSNIMLVMGVAPAIAPTLGSIFLDVFQWQSIFLFLTIFSALVLIFVRLFLIESTGYNAKISLSPRQIATDYWQTLRHSAFTKFTISGSVAMSLLFCYIVAIPFILMNIYGVTERTFGWIFGSNAVGLVLGSQLNRIMLRKMPLVRLTNTVFVLIVLLTSSLFLASLFINIPLVLFCIAIFLMLFLIGFINPNAMALAMDNVQGHFGLASALNGSLRMGFGSIVSALFGYFYDGTARPLYIFLLVLSLLAFLLHLWALRDDNHRYATEQ